MTILGAVRNIINLNDISIENFTNNLLFGTPIVVVPCSCRVWIPVVCKIDSVKKKKKSDGKLGLSVILRIFLIFGNLSLMSARRA